MKTVSKTENFLGLDDEWADIERAKVVIFPAPYEFTSSYVKGAKNAPQAILSASQYVELYDEELSDEPYKWTGGIATLFPMKFDENCKDATAVHEISKQVQSLLDAGKFIVTLGGEHTIAVGAVKAHSARYENLSVLQLDAHADLRQQYEENPYSHASTMARIYEFNKNIVPVGIRSLCVEEKDFIQQNEIKTFYAYKMKEGFYEVGRRKAEGGSKEEVFLPPSDFPLPTSSAPTWHDAVINQLTEFVYLTLDCDYFDPSVIPSLGTPEPGGFGWDETLRFLKKLTASKKIVGFDVSEISPANFFSKKSLGLVYSEFTIAKLIYKLIGYIFRFPNL
ncbi:agmatinase family protein [Candidatus Poribacteria bacterium]|nr:agmatinase family protein [Candidatus Poribacteria bacterium]